MPPNKRPDADTVRRKRRLIALKYDRDPKRGVRGKPDPKGIRVRDLMRLLHHRIQSSNIPDDWYAWQLHGREISRVIISHLARMPDVRKRIKEFIACYPGLPQSEIDAIVARPRQWNAVDRRCLVTLVAGGSR